MRDKVKRFISILMTALMLVNLLPVGALAEGVKISNSVQSRAGEKPKMDTNNIYLYAEITGGNSEQLALLNKLLKRNNSKYYTIGKKAGIDMPGTHKWSWGQWVRDPETDSIKTYRPGSAVAGKTLPSVDTALTKMQRLEENNLIPIDVLRNNASTAVYKFEAGADSYVPDGSIATWHLDFKIPITDLNFPYTVKHINKENNEVLDTETVIKAVIGTEVSADPKSFPGYKWDGNPIEKKTITGSTETVIHVYYVPDETTVRVIYAADKGGTITENVGPYDIQPVTGNLSNGGGRLPTPTLKVDSGYQFVGWERNDGQTYSDLSDVYSKLKQETVNAGKYEYTLYQDTTFTAKFEPNKYPYEVHYYLKGTTDTVPGLTDETGTAAYGSSLERSPLTAEGYTPVSSDSKNITIGTEKNEIIFYYTKNSYAYTVEHYWIGDKDKPFLTDADESMTAPYGSTVSGVSWVITTNPAYTSVEAVPGEITIGTDPNQNVLKLYYYKNVKLIANSDEKTYNGEEQLVSGYTCEVAKMKDDGSVEYVKWEGKPLTFDGISASGLGTDVNEKGYPVRFNDTPIGEHNDLYYVNASQTGTLTIKPALIKLHAPNASKTYDGKPLEATQFGHSYLEGVNFADDFASIILTGSQTLVGSSASLITGVIPEEGKQLTNYNFTFVPGTLTVTDGTGEEEKPVDPAKVITKTHIPKDMGYNLGETVTFTVSVKNIYNTPKTITLTEKANVKFSNGDNAIEFTDVPAGETVTAEATYTITSADILAGVFHNTVTADFTGGGSWTAEDTVTTAELNTTLNVTKTSDVPEGQKAALGQTITYTITVENAGNVPYTNVKVEDPLTGLTETIETLAVGETQTFTTEYVVTEADVLKGSVLNTATATGDKIKDPKSDEPKEPNGGDEVEIKTFAPITIKPKDVTATYNGAAITGKDVEITSGKLLEGHKLSAAVIGSGVNAGSYELTLDPEKIKIVDANNKDVSEMYARTLLPGKLIINKRRVLITSQSATKTYDGSALTRPAVTITGDGFVPGKLAKAEATGSITNVGSTPNAIQYTTTGAFNAANYSIALSVGTLTVTEKPKPEPRRTFNLTINYVYQNGKRAAASYNRGGLKNGETFDITSPVIAGYTASETVVSGTIYNRDIKVTVIYTADGVNLDDYGVPLGLGNITMNVGDCFE